MNHSRVISYTNYHWHVCSSSPYNFHVSLELTWDLSKIT